jgi:hypothetical protein
MARGGWPCADSARKHRSRCPSLGGALTEYAMLLFDVRFTQPCSGNPPAGRPLGGMTRASEWATRVVAWQATARRPGNLQRTDRLLWWSSDLKRKGVERPPGNPVALMRVLLKHEARPRSLAVVVHLGSVRMMNSRRLKSSSLGAAARERLATDRASCSSASSAMRAVSAPARARWYKPLRLLHPVVGTAPPLGIRRSEAGEHRMTRLPFNEPRRIDEAKRRD